LAAAALQRAAADDRIDTVVVGVSSLQRLAQLQQLIDTVIPAEFWAAVDALGDPPQPGLDR
jgi:D-threo-aldose 1-dehydrogenase